jgi:hypothetical protein
MTAFMSRFEVDVGSMNHRFSRFSQLSPSSSLSQSPAAVDLLPSERTPDRHPDEQKVL